MTFSFFVYICHMNETSSKIIQSAIKVWGNDIQASLDDIAKNVNISRRTLHRHFSGRDDLLKSVFELIFQNSLIEVKRLVKEYSNLEERLAAFFKYDVYSGSETQVFCQIRKTQFQELIYHNQSLIELRQIYLDLFEVLKKQNAIREELTVEWIETMYLVVLESVLTNSIEDSNIEEQILMAWTTFWNGIKQ